MVRRLTVSVCAAGLITGIATATPVEFKMTGVVYGSRDNLGVFGDAGASLVGQTFTATYLFDPALQPATIHSATEYASSSNEFKTGPSIGLGASLTINGHTVHVGGQYAGEVHVKESADESLLMIAQYDYDDATGITTTMETDIGDDFGIGYGSPLLGPWTGSVTPLNSFASWRLEDDFGAIEWVSMDTRHVAISAPAPAPVPEPASWALMIGGFGLIGAMLRTRRRIAFA